MRRIVVLSAAVLIANVAACAQEEGVAGRCTKKSLKFAKGSEPAYILAGTAGGVALRRSPGSQQ